MSATRHKQTMRLGRPCLLRSVTDIALRDKHIIYDDLSCLTDFPVLPAVFALHGNIVNRITNITKLFYKV